MSDEFVARIIYRALSIMNNILAYPCQYIDSEVLKYYYGGWLHEYGVDNWMFSKHKTLQIFASSYYLR